MAADLFANETVEGNHVIPVSDFFRDDTTAEKWLENQWNSRLQNGETIRKNLPEVVRRAENNFDLIADIFKGAEVS